MDVFVDFSVLCKPVSVSGSQKASAAAYSLNTELTLGQAEVVEAVYDRPSPTHAFLSLQREEMVPEYCEVREISHIHSHT